MKKIFWLIGVILVVFSAYFMLLVADKSDYMSNEEEADFSLEKQIGLDSLEKFAKESEVSIQIRTINEYSLGNVQCKIEIINPTEDIQYGTKKDLFPNKHIEIVPNEKKEGRTVRYFIVQDHDVNKIKALGSLLEENGYEPWVLYLEPIVFKPSMLVSPLNIGFFVSIFCLSLFCTVVYYISRLKEIGILKLNGWSEQRISVRLYLNILKNTAYGFVPGAIVFVLYIIFRDISKIPSYLTMLFFCS
ncbi:hypothetical protein [Eubacterium oxidoreducens]|uniref:FtsX-like permease family protein n=1 Tax=Eubacterium oxidoreducens TaxID=1732 RepID=A0A1G6BYI8_EUBOX|nr:hypothetical protein [Eubacterium oxidoreducens]SDB25691.1 hypothetical protein SAMN02910417_01921 [Eubacterium oxidoreducens]